MSSEHSSGNLSNHRLQPAYVSQYLHVSTYLQAWRTAATTAEKIKLAKEMGEKCCHQGEHHKIEALAKAETDPSVINALKEASGDSYYTYICMFED